MSRTSIPGGRRGRLRRGIAGLVAVAAALSGAALVPAPAGAAEGDLTEDLVGWWKLDETTGTTAADSSGNARHGTVNGAATWNDGDGFTFSGGANSGGNAVRLPNDLLAGLDEVTVDLDVWVDPGLTGNNFIFNLGNAATWPNGTGYLFVTDRDANSRFRATIAENGGGNGGEQSVSRAGGLTRGTWKHVTYTVTGGSVGSPGSAQLYEDGELVASSSTITTSPGLIGTPDGASTHNFLGRSAYAGDRSFQGRLRDVRIYSRSLTPAEAAERALDTSTTGVDSDTETLSLGDTSAVTGDLDLPVTGPEGSRITWESSAPAVVAADGSVTRPAFGEPDVTLTVTATLTRGLVSRTKDFEVTVLADLDDASKVQQALEAIELVHADDVRGNLTLPEAGSSGVAFTWATDAPGVVSPTGEVTRPAHGEAPVDVVLTVTGSLGEATDERAIVVHVRPMPAPLDPEAYAFAYFAGESTADGEKIYFAASQGNDPLAYDELNDGAPLLESDL
ncbi:immunoglobulin-like domain-containing protein, partial [Nocardioides sp.]|uniref:immunoglobulin-like domain-containing protein n=1 Tax=Nocardioides sp. TaxID=35761 RepID=UPI00273779C5